MIPVFQTIVHDPDNQQYGDCMRACIASVMEYPIEAVPHFLHDGIKDGELFHQRIRKFLYKDNLTYVEFAFAGEFQQVLDMMRLLNPDIYYILGCTSIRGFPHSVVCYNNRVVHDPANIVLQKYNSLEGHYWVGIIAHNTI